MSDRIFVMYPSSTAPSLTLDKNGLQIQSITPRAIIRACLRPSERYLRTSSSPQRKSDCLLVSSVVEFPIVSDCVCSCSIKLSIPNSSASSSRLPNSEITVPTASFSDIPSCINSSYLSSIISINSAFARNTCGVSGRFKNILCKYSLIASMFYFILS